jgi:hypothetical protein
MRQVLGFLEHALGEGSPVPAGSRDRAHEVEAARLEVVRQAKRVARSEYVG